jgi:hypothetical protein
MNRHHSLLAAALALVLPTGATSAEPAEFGWTISNSTTDPLSNSGPIPPGQTPFEGNLYLWLYCSTQSGVLAAEFDVVSIDGDPVVEFVGMNGFQARWQGFFPDRIPVRLWSNDCPRGPVLAGRFTVGADFGVGQLELCIQPSLEHGRNATITCRSRAVHPNVSRGFSKNGVFSCPGPLLCEFPLPVAGESWGRVKAAYR